MTIVVIIIVPQIVWTQKHGENPNFELNSVIWEGILFKFG